MDFILLDTCLWKECGLNVLCSPGQKGLMVFTEMNKTAEPQTVIVVGFFIFILLYLQMNLGSNRAFREWAFTTSEASARFSSDFLYHPGPFSFSLSLSAPLRFYHLYVHH